MLLLGSIAHCSLCFWSLTEQDAFSARISCNWSTKFLIFIFILQFRVVLCFHFIYPLRTLLSLAGVYRTFIFSSVPAVLWKEKLSRVSHSHSWGKQTTARTKNSHIVKATKNGVYYSGWVVVISVIWKIENWFLIVSNGRPKARIEGRKKGTWNTIYIYDDCEFVRGQKRVKNDGEFRLYSDAYIAATKGCAYWFSYKFNDILIAAIRTVGRILAAE